jgi:hypothetical protein
MTHHWCEQCESCLVRIGLCNNCAQTTAEAFRQADRLRLGEATYILCSDKCSDALCEWRMEGAQCPEGKDLS